MRFKHRIWLLPIMTAVIVSAGIAINSRITTHASEGLARVEKVQYPTVEAIRSLRADVTKIQEALQQAVAEGDQTAIKTAEEHAAAIKVTLNQLRTLDGGDHGLAEKLGTQFDNYYVSATRATRVLLNLDKGDSATVVASMQMNAQALTSLLAATNDKALADFRALLAGGADDVRSTLRVSMIAAGIMLFTLGIGSWILINSVFGSLGGEPEEAAEIVRRIAGGDFTAQVAVQNGDTSSLLHGIATLRTKLGDLIRDVHRSSAAVDTAAVDMNQAVGQLSARTAGQAASLEQTASSMEQMTETVKQNADNARHASELASATRNQAEAGGQVVNRAITAMSEINASSKRIADISGVIDEIAFQTNLLALNAAVEAARAGEQGRGFAVVAIEVRNLAQRSGTAAREIKTLIQDSVAKVQDGSTLVDESGRHLNDIVKSVKKVADIIREISAASQEQANGLEQVNTAVMQMDQMTQQNSAMADETSSVATTMTNQAKQLLDIVGVFRIENGPQARTPASARSSALRAAPSRTSLDQDSWEEVA